MRRIKTIHLEHFKQFENIKLELSSMDCLVGGNNSGKSTLLQALALFDFVVHHCLNRKNGHGSPYEIKNRSIFPEEFFVLPVATSTDLWTNRITQKKGKPVLIRFHVEFDDGKKVMTAIDMNYNRFQMITETENHQEWLEELASYNLSYLPIFSSFLAQEERRTPAVIEDALARGRVNSVMRNLLLDLKQQKKLPKLIEILKRTFPTLQQIKVEFDEIVNRFITVTYQEAGRENDFDLFMSGSGFQQFIYLFGFILLRNPNVILLDEPDIHLHGLLQNALCEELKRFVDQGKQIVFATHSSDIISKIDPAHLIYLDAGKARRLKIRFDIYDTLKSLGSFDNIQITKLQSFRRLFIVENESDWKLIRVFGTKTLGEETWMKIEQKLSIWFAKGNPMKQDIEKLKNQLSETFELSGEPLRIFVLCDLDYCPERNGFMKKKNKDSNLEFYFWEGNEIENYLLQPSAIVRFIQSKQCSQTLTQTEFEKKFNELVEESRDQVEIQCIDGIEYYERQVLKSGKSTSSLAKAAKEFLKENWESNKLLLTDAKKIVLPGLKRWLQENGFSQFSDLALAKSMTLEELPNEMKVVFRKIKKFS
ncbi:MAG: AAA family ATPase, partial [Planctomycetaceae bacterium]|nr:AAA family ATPase [Planctomycetaceae bacterium]